MESKIKKVLRSLDILYKYLGTRGTEKLDLMDKNLTYAIRLLQSLPNQSEGDNHNSVTIPSRFLPNQSEGVEFKDILQRKIDYYGETKFAYQSACDEYIQSRLSSKPTMVTGLSADKILWKRNPASHYSSSIVFTQEDCLSAMNEFATQQLTEAKAEIERLKQIVSIQLDALRSYELTQLKESKNA